MLPLQVLQREIECVLFAEPTSQVCLLNQKKTHSTWNCQCSRQCLYRAVDFIARMEAMHWEKYISFNVSFYNLQDAQRSSGFQFIFHTKEHNESKPQTLSVKCNNFAEQGWGVKTCIIEKTHIQIPRSYSLNLIWDFVAIVYFPSNKINIDPFNDEKRLWCCCSHLFNLEWFSKKLNFKVGACKTICTSFLF